MYHVLIFNQDNTVLTQDEDLAVAMRQAFNQATGTPYTGEVPEKQPPQAVVPQCPTHEASLPSSKHPGSFYCPGQTPNGKYCKWTSNKR